jgi:hypothetical protein
MTICNLVLGEPSPALLLLSLEFSACRVGDSNNFVILFEASRTSNKLPVTKCTLKICGAFKLLSYQVRLWLTLFRLVQGLYKAK